MQKTITLRKACVNVCTHDRDSKYNTAILPARGTVRIIPEGYVSGVRVLARGTRGKVLDAVDKYVESVECPVTIPTKGKRGRIVRSGRLFGVELELIRGKQLLREHAQRADGFVLKGDGSVDGEGNELVTPPLSGTSAEYILPRVLIPATENASTNTSCGMHIHIDARDYKELCKKGKYIQFIRLVCLYMALQPMMFALVPRSRRNNSYTKRTDARAHIVKLCALVASGELDTALHYVKYEICNGDRYQAFNLAPWYQEGHYEYRLHSGTHDTRKVLEWANLHTCIADYAMRNKVTEKQLLALYDAPARATIDTVCDMIKASAESRAYLLGRFTRFNA